MRQIVSLLRLFANEERAGERFLRNRISLIAPMNHCVGRAALLRRQHRGFAKAAQQRRPAIRCMDELLDINEFVRGQQRAAEALPSAPVTFLDVRFVWL